MEELALTKEQISEEEREKRFARSLKRFLLLALVITFYLSLVAALIYLMGWRRTGLYFLLGILAGSLLGGASARETSLGGYGLIIFGSIILPLIAIYLSYIQVASPPVFKASLPLLGAFLSSLGLTFITASLIKPVLSLYPDNNKENEQVGETEQNG